MSRPDRGEIRGVVFDKDGTLIDFHASWDPLFHDLISGLAGDDGSRLAEAAAAIGFDLETVATRSDSPIIAGSNAELADLLAPVFGASPGDPGFLAEVEARLAAGMPAAVREVPGAGAVIAELAASGLPLGLATNDSEAGARRQLTHLGWTDHFVSVLGYDSGYGAKPAPGMVLASAAAMGLPAADVAVVGDSRHDLEAARAAGALAVLYGGRPEIAALADVAVESLEALIGLLGGTATQSGSP